MRGLFINIYECEFYLKGKCKMLQAYFKFVMV